MSYWTSSIGRKHLMGISGLVFSFFVLGHMLGNLTIFLGPEAYNHYGHAIVSNKLLLYGTEVVLILSLVIHTVMGVWLTKQNKAARKEKYSRGTNGPKAAEFASKSMMYQGVVLFFFIIWHLITFKFGPHYTVVYDGVEMRDLFSLLVEKFSDPLYVFGYVICMFFVGTHLSHGFSSAFQSLGFNHPKYTPVLRNISIMYAMGVALGFLSQPIYIYLFY